MFAQLVAEELAMRQGVHRQPAREMVVYPVEKGYAYHLVDAFGYAGVSFPLTLLGNAHADILAASRFLDAHNVGYDVGPLIDAARAGGLPVRLGPLPGPEPARLVKVVGLGETGGHAAEVVALRARPEIEVWAFDRDPAALNGRHVPGKYLWREADWRHWPFRDSPEAVVVMGAAEEPTASLMAPFALAAWAKGVPALGLAIGGPTLLGSDVEEAFDVFLTLEDASLSRRFGTVAQGLAQVALRILGPLRVDASLRERILRAKHR